MSKEKNNKTARIDMRVVPELKERAGDVARSLGKSRNQFIEDVIWKAVLSPEHFFVLCPKCKEPLFDVEEIPISEGIQSVTCSNGHVHYFDFETEKFIK